MTARSLLRSALLLGALATAAVSPVRAQRAPGASQRIAPGIPRQGAGRPALDKLAVVVQRRLGLSNEQSARLRETTARFAAERQRLVQRERETRRALRLATATGDSSADQRVIGRQLDSLVALQQRRVALLAEEQREMATFLTPYQRAQFLAMQERALRAAQQLRQQRAAAREPLP